MAGCMFRGTEEVGLLDACIVCAIIVVRRTNQVPAFRA